MICPSCGGEFVEEVMRCPDCGVDLIEPRDPEESPQGAIGADFGSWVQVANVGNPAVLPVLRSVLEAAGIPFHVQGDFSTSIGDIDPIVAQTHCKLLVPERFAAEARSLLEENDPDAVDVRRATD